MSHRVEQEIAGRPLILETGRLAGQANGAVVVRQGDTMLLVTAVAGPPREGIDFFPLTIDFEERLYAVGRIPGSFFRREGRPTQEAILTMRLTDRPLRPLFPKGMRSDIQVIITTLSADQEHDPQHLAIIGASAALSISDIPFGGPVSATRIGFIGGKLVANPTFQEQQESDLDLMVAGTREAVVMVEAGANEVSEEIVLQGMKMAQIVNAETIELQEELMRSAAKPKFTVKLPEPAPEDLADAVANAAGLGAGRRPLQAGPQGRARRRRGRGQEACRRRPRRPLRPRRGGQAVRGPPQGPGARERAQPGRPPRRARPGRDPPHYLRGRRLAPHPWQRPLHPRRDAGAHHHDPRLAEPQTAPRHHRHRGHQALHASVQHAAVLDRRGQAHRQLRPSRDRPRRARRAGAPPHGAG